MNPRALWNRLVQPLAWQLSLLPPSAKPGHSGNPVPGWLDVAGLPWRATRGELAARYGVHADNPYQWDLVPLDVRPPPLPGMLWPFGFQAFPRYSPKMPPVTLSTHVSIGEDTEANILSAAGGFAQHLGANAVADQYNTRRVDWRWGAASVTLIVWPPGKQSGAKPNNPAHRRDPRLATACSVTVQTGWRLPLSPRDRAWLDGFVPMGTTRNWTPVRPRAGLGQTMFAETQLEFMREPPADLARFRGAFGFSADGEALIFCEDALYVVPLAQVEAFQVTRTLPAKGGGGSYLSARCDTGYAACPTKDVQVAQGERAHDLFRARGRQRMRSSGRRLQPPHDPADCRFRCPVAAYRLSRRQQRAQTFLVPAPHPAPEPGRREQGCGPVSWYPAG